MWGRGEQQRSEPWRTARGHPPAQQPKPELGASRPRVAAAGGQAGARAGGRLAGQLPLAGGGAVPSAVAGGGQRAGGKDAVGGGAFVLTCRAAVLLFLFVLVVRDKRGRVEGVGGQRLRLEGGGGALRRGRRRGLVAPRERRPAQARLLGRQQPALGLVVLPAPLGLQAAVIPFLLSPLRAEQTKAKVRQRSGGPRPLARPRGAGRGAHPAPVAARMPRPRGMPVQTPQAARRSAPRAGP